MKERFDNFFSASVSNFQELRGGAVTHTMRAGSVMVYQGSSSSNDDECVTAYDTIQEARADGSDTLKSIDGAYDNGDQKWLF